MMDSMEGNGWETPSVRKTLGSEFNLMEPGNQLKSALIHKTQAPLTSFPGIRLLILRLPIT